MFLRYITNRSLFDGQRGDRVGSAKAFMRRIPFFKVQAGVFIRNTNSFRLLIAGCCIGAALSLPSPASGERQPVVRTEFQDIIPKFIRLPDGRFTGISYDLMMMIQRRSGIVFSFPDAPVPISRVVMNLERGETDVQIGLQKSVEREKTLVFGEPLYSVKTVALMRANDTADFSSLDDLKRFGPGRGAVLTVWGTATAAILKSMHGLAVDDSAKTVEDAIHKLAIGRGRVLIYHNLSLVHVLKTSAYAERLKIVAVNYGNSCLLSDARQYVVFSNKTDPQIVRRINRAILESRADGELERITSKYLD